MPQGIAITHADLARKQRGTNLGSKTGVILIVLTILCGLCCFILCLIAEATRSEVTWMADDDSREDKDGAKYECMYSGSGKIPLLCAAAAFVGLATAMVVEHAYMLIAVSKMPPTALVSWEDSSFSNHLNCQAAVFFISTWICFAVGEILMLIGLSVESGHLNNWSKPRPSCLVMREGVFSAAGVFALATVFLAAGLYLTALQAQRKFHDIENVRREVLEAASALYMSPPRSPRRIPPAARENPVTRDNQVQHAPFVSPQVFIKQSTPV